MPVDFSNKGISRLLREMAAAHEIKGDSRFRINAYYRAADSVENSTIDIKDIWAADKLTDLPGIGSTIASSLDEYFRTGKSKHFSQVKAGIEPVVFDLMQIPDVGPKTAHKLTTDLGLKSIGELKKAAEKNLIAGLFGFGEQSQAEILQGIQALEGRSKRILLPEAVHIAEKIIRDLKKAKGVSRVDMMGSLRRMAPTIGDVDLAVATEIPEELIEAFVRMPFVERVVAKGPAKASIINKEGVQVDLRAQSPETYGSQLQYFTGSKNHNIALRRYANELGYSLSEYGITRLKNGGGSAPTKFASEEDFYKFLGLDWVSPELREDWGEIDAARNHKLPQLVELKDIKGDLHIHAAGNFTTTFDGGTSSVLEIAQKAKEFGYEYVCIGSHSLNTRDYSVDDMTGIITKINKDIEETFYSDSIERSLYLLNSVEIDIHADNSLSLPDQILEKYDIVVASIHSAFRQERDKMTERILTAIRNPFVDIIGHPSGRLLLERESYDVDWRKVFTECLNYSKILEVNAQPRRLDLPEDLIKEAVSQGVQLVIDSDAHFANDMSVMQYGVSAARRGWAEKKDIINTLPWTEFKKRMNIKRY